MLYRLKPTEEAFQVVSGPYRLRRYEAGEIYTEIPPEEIHRFEPLAAESNVSEMSDFKFEIADNDRDGGDA